MMGQQDVVDFLRTNHSRWYTSKQIASELNLSMGSVTSNLKKLRKSKAIHYELENKKGRRNYIYSHRKTTIKKILNTIGLDALG